MTQQQARLLLAVILSAFIMSVGSELEEGDETSGGPSSLEELIWARASSDNSPEALRALVR